MASKTIRVLSLFSGCGGMDLGLEGGFSIHKGCINEKSNPDFIEKQERGELVKLHSTRFQLVFANDILKEARTAWTHYFAKYGYTPDVYREESIVDLVKRHKAGELVFPEKVDVVTGGFRVRISVWRGNVTVSILIKIIREKLLMGRLPRKKPVVSYICG